MHRHVGPRYIVGGRSGDVRSGNGDRSMSDKRLTSQQYTCVGTNGLPKSDIGTVMRFSLLGSTWLMGNCGAKYTFEISVVRCDHQRVRSSFIQRWITIFSPNHFAIVLDLTTSRFPVFSPTSTRRLTLCTQPRSGRTLPGC